MKTNGNLFKGCSAYEERIVRAMVLVLVERLERDNPVITYSDLARQLRCGHRHLSMPLLRMKEVFDRISPRPPYLNALCVLKSTGLPGKGLANVEPDYRLRGERVVMVEMNRRAKAYKNWDEVLQLISQN